MLRSHKPHSITSDTRISNSNIFNNSYLMNTSVPDHNNTISHQIRESQNRQIQFLRIKNNQLNERVKRMTLSFKQMEESNRVLLDMNRKYVQVVNKYYENQNKRTADNLNKHTNKNRKNDEDFEISHQNINLQNMPPQQAHKHLEQLEKDHRNLTKHCLVMEQQIKNYSKQIVHYNKMKDQLYAVNHTSVNQLIQQLQDLTQQNKYLKKQNNQISYELQKYKFEHTNLKKKHMEKQQEAGNGEAQIMKMKSIVNTVKQQSEDKAKNYQSRIYQLELKVEKLEQELRSGQECVYKTTEQRKDLVMKHVQQVHDYQKLRKSYIDLQNVIQNRVLKKRPYSMNSKKANISMHNIFQNDVNTINSLNGIANTKNRKSKFKKTKQSVSGISALI